MHDEFLSNLAKMNREELGTHYDNISKEKNHGRSLMLDPDLTDDQVRDEIKSLLDEPQMDYGDDEDEYGVGRLPESVVRIIVAEGAALKLAGLLGSCELNYDAIQEAIHDDALRSMLAEADVYAPHSDVVAMIAGLDPDEVSDSDYVADDSGEVLLAAGQKAGSSPYHPSYKNVRKPSWYMDDHDHDHDEDDVQAQYQTAIEEYAADFQGEQYDDPSGAAMDAAQGFFAMHPEWKTWSQELDLSKKDMTDAIQDLVYSSIMGEGLQLEAEYRGREVPLGKPMKGDTAKFKVYVKDKKTGNVKKVNFGSKGMEIRRDNPKARKSFRARHGCGTSRASDRTKAAWWSCKMWSKKPVSDILKGK
jgi:hypothetical protein